MVELPLRFIHVTAIATATRAALLLCSGKHERPQVDTSQRVFVQATQAVWCYETLPHDEPSCAATTFLRQATVLYPCTALTRAMQQPGRLCVHGRVSRARISAYMAMTLGFRCRITDTDFVHASSHQSHIPPLPVRKPKQSVKKPSNNAVVVANVTRHAVCRCIDLSVPGPVQLQKASSSTVAEARYQLRVSRFCCHCMMVVSDFLNRLVSPCLALPHLALPHLCPACRASSP